MVPVHIRTRMAAVALLLAFVAIGAAPAFAQFDTATVLGTVRDDTGGVVPGATVTLTSLDTGIETTRVSDGNGNFEFMTVRVGRYRVSAELDGFAVALAADVQVTIGARQRVDLRLEPGAITATVSVVGAATRLETDTSQRGQLITAAQVVELPLNSREYATLALLSPGVRQSALSTGGFTPREGSFNVNGLRSTFNNFLLDGLDNNAYGTSNQGFSNQVMQPSPDSVAEFRVVTNNLSAEYGRSGGATVNVASRSGTNQFRGAAWEFYRDTKLNATGFFRPATGEKPPLRRNQFGGTFGGPILRNKAFFFADYEGFRQSRKLVAFQTIPTPAQRQGVLPVAVRNPLTGEVFPAGTQIPMTDFARKVLAGLPDPNVPGAAANNFTLLQEFKNDNDKYNGRVDVQLNPLLSLFGRYGYRNVDIFDDPPLPLPSGGAGNAFTFVTSRQFATGFTWARSGSSLLEGRLGWSRTEAGKNPHGLGTPGALEAFGISGLPTDPRVAGGLPTQIITGFSDLGRQATNPQWQFPEMWNPKVNYTWVAGRQSLKTGYEYQFIKTEVQDVNPLYGRDQYNGQFSRPAGVGANNVYNLADFMFGLRANYALSTFLIANLRQQMHFAYIQDDFRVNDRLALNLGLRYEYATPWYEQDNIMSNFDPDTRQMVLAREGSLRERALIEPDRNNFGPRLGFAYTLTPRTVMRGGYGISYIHFHRAGGANVLSINGPQSVTAVVTQSNPLAPTFRPTQQGYPEGFADPSRFNPLAANVTYMPEDYRSSRVQSYYISVQREVAQNMIVDVAYVANKSDGLLLFANFNQAVPNNPQGTIPLAQRRPIPEFGDITYSFNGGRSQYDSLQIKYDYRMRGGLMLLNSFTWSRALDNAAGSLENPNGNSAAPQNFFDLDADWGTSGYDEPFNNTTSFVWELPVGLGRRWMSAASPLVDALLGGWTLSGISTAKSGAPVNLRYTPAAAFLVSGITQDFRGANAYRPNVVGDPYGDRKSITNYLNRDTVLIPTDPSQPFGNAERNSVRAPHFWQIDFVATKNFRVPVGSQTRAQFRLEAFNLFNRVNFGAPNGNRSAGGFGAITSTFDARQIQLGVKLTF